MVSRLKLFPLAIVAVLALALAACGGGSSNHDSSGGASNQTQDSGSSGGSAYGAHGSGAEAVDYVADAQAVLSQSTTKFAAQDVSSMKGDVVFDFTMGTTAINGNANFSYKAPDQMYMTMGFQGGDSQSLMDLSQLGTLEVLVRDGGAYINIPILGGWIYLSPEDMAAFGGDSMQNVMSRGSLFDYSGFMKNANGVQYVGEEDVDGHSTVHYSVTGGLQDLIAAFSDALSTTGDNALSDQILGSQLSGPISVDVWIGKDDSLPYKMTAGGNISVPDGTALVMDVTATFHDYNAAVTIPPAPKDAQPFAAVLGALGAQPPAAPTP